MRNITIVGTGYVGISIAVLLAQKNNVVAYDIDKKKIEQLNNASSPIQDKDIEKFLSQQNLNLHATSNKIDAYLKAEYVIVATPTDYDPVTKKFDTKSVETVIDDVININKNATIVIKSTVPIGFTARLSKKYKYQNIFFSPEFLREGKALIDNLYPSRIVIGQISKDAKIFSDLLKDGAYSKSDDISVIFTSSDEAEAIKLFSNSYLALRVAYFNELDSFCEINNLNAKQVIEGVSLDTRIGNFYNNPSFGYGGYCLPKDTKQLLANFKDVPNNIIKAIVDANYTRKEFIVNSIIKRSTGTIGIYRLIMKQGSDNLRGNSTQYIIDKLVSKNKKIILYEPLLDKSSIEGVKIINSLKDFKDQSSIILCNRMSDDLIDVKSKVYTRDIYGED
jgi:UDPglucose 6-dehydrogenase